MCYVYVQTNGQYNSGRAIPLDNICDKYTTFSLRCSFNSI